MNDIKLKFTDVLEQHYHESYDDDKFFQKVEHFIDKEFTNFLVQYQIKYSGKLTQELKNFSLNFINNPNKQYFYINRPQKKKDDDDDDDKYDNGIFIEYDCKEYQIIKEDAIIYSILHNVSSNHIVTSEQKQTLKNKIILSIKNQSILNTIPDSFTIQNILKYMGFFCPSKNYCKYILTIIGDNILKKNSEEIYLFPEKAKSFVNYVELSVCNLLGKTNCIKNIKYKWHSHNYKQCRIITFDNTITMTETWEKMLKKHCCDFVVVACHYSEQYGDADKYLSKNNNSLPSNILYLKDKTSETIVDDFINDFISVDEKLKITWEDMVYIWKDWLKKKEIHIPMYQKTLKDKLGKHFKWSDDHNSFINCTSIHILYIEYFKRFWEKHITLNLSKEQEEYIELSEMKDIYSNWLHSYNFGPHSDYKNYFLTENKIRHIINHFYKDIIIHEKKYIVGVVCSLWDKKKSISNVLKKITIKNETNINYINLYKLYCKKCREENQMIVNKNYFITNLKHIIDAKYLKSNTVSVDFWS